MVFIPESHFQTPGCPIVMNKPYIVFFSIWMAMLSFTCKHEPRQENTVVSTPSIPAKASTIPTYWEDPRVFEYGRELPRADFKVFETEPKALTNQYSASAYYASLNGFWKYRFFTGPDEVPAEIESTVLTNGWLEISMPGFAELKGLGKPIFKYFGLPFPLHYPNVPHDTNSVLILKKSIQVPENWKERDVFAVFEGISTSYFLYVNGALTGYNEDTKNTSEFKINKFLKPGLNDLTLVLFRYSDGSYWETHNQWSLTGINRNAYLLARPRLRIRDFFAKPDLKGNTGLLQIEAEVLNEDNHTEDIVVEAKILDAKTRMVLVSGQNKLQADGSSVKKTSISLQLKNATPWTDEIPYSYDVLVNIKTNEGKIIESAFCKTAFYNLSYQNGLTLNGKKILLKGVAAHEFHLVNGNLLDKQWIDNDMDVMKLHNINAIRNNHYPFDSYWYESALKYGLYITEECNLDPSALQNAGIDFSKDTAGTNCFLQRVRNTFERTKNYPNILVWSLGHECGLGPNTEKAIRYLKSRDTKRPVGAFSGGKSMGDIDFNPGEMTAKSCAIRYNLGTNQGNSLGGFTDRWTGLCRLKEFAGGFIEDFTDQCFYMKNSEGKLFFGYGGVFGETKSDSFLCARGIFTSNKTPNPPVKIVADMFANFDVQPVNIESGIIAITNRYKFYHGDNYNFFWTIDQNGEKISEGKFDQLVIGPGQTKNVTVNLNSIPRLPGKEYCVTILIEKIVNNKGMFRFLNEKIEKLCLPVSSPQPPTLSDLRPWAVQTSEQKIDLSRDKIHVEIDKSKGWINSCKDGELSIFTTPLRPMLYRAPTDFDLIMKRSSEILRWQKWSAEARASSFSINAADQNRIEISLNLSASCIEGVTANLRYLFYATGDVVMQIDFQNSSSDITQPPRIAWTANIPSQMGTASWYGRGPYETYPDRRFGLHVGLYKSSVTDFNIPRIRPQEMSNKTDTRWAELSTFDSHHLCLMGLPTMDFKVLPFDEEELYGKNLYGVNVRAGKDNHFVAGKEIWPMDDRSTAELVWTVGQKLSASIRWRIYSKDHGIPSEVWSSGLP